MALGLRSVVGFHRCSGGGGGGGGFSLGFAGTEQSAPTLKQLHKILKGSKDQAVRGKRWDRLPEHGACAHLTNDELELLLYRCIGRKFLKEREVRNAYTDYSDTRVFLGVHASDLLAGRASLRVRLAKRGARKASAKKKKKKKKKKKTTTKKKKAAAKTKGGAAANGAGKRKRGAGVAAFFAADDYGDFEGESSGDDDEGGGLLRGFPARIGGEHEKRLLGVLHGVCEAERARPVWFFIRHQPKLQLCARFGRLDNANAIAFVRSYRSPCFTQAEAQETVERR